MIFPAHGTGYEIVCITVEKDSGQCDALGGLQSTAVVGIKAGKKNGCLIEGMACPGGCIAGAGTNIALNQAAREVQRFKDAALKQVPDSTK